jgi:hypothetical protein
VEGIDCDKYSKSLQYKINWELKKFYNIEPRYAAVNLKRLENILNIINKVSEAIFTTFPFLHN